MSADQIIPPPIDKELIPVENPANHRHVLHNEYLNSLQSYEDCIEALNLISIRITHFKKQS